MPQAAQVSPSLAEQESRQGVAQPFALPDQVPRQLSQSYSLLQARVSDLKGELAVVIAQRLEELNGKARLANRL